MASGAASARRWRTGGLTPRRSPGCLNVTTAPPTPTSAKGKRRLLVLLGVLLLAGAGVGGYFLWRPRATPVPPIRTGGLDVEVVAAIDKARADVAARPRSADAWGQLGMVLFAHDMYADCADVFAEAQRLDPADARWPYFRGLAVILIKPDEGIALLERAVQLRPRNFSLRLRLAEEYLKLDRLDEADALFRDLLAEQPDNPRALLGHGRILSRRGQWQEALEPLAAAAGHPTARHSARVALAEAYQRLGNETAAEDERKRAAEAPADADWPDTVLEEARWLQTGLAPRVHKILRLSDGGETDEALTLADQLVRDHPDSDEAHLTRAKVLLRANRFRDAEPELRRAVALNDNLVDGHFLLAVALTARKDYEAAEREYLRAIELKPAYALAHYNLGDCRLKQGKKAEAIQAFRDAVRYRPDLAAAHLELGALLLQDGQRAEATTHLEEAVRLDGKNERARKLLEEARAKRKP
jgi:tetratricopeptide (TPR) repeat protein